MRGDTRWSKLPSSMSSFRAILSPCVGVCAIGEDGLCEGCHRTLDEIARWSTMDDDQRLRLMGEVLPEREHQRRTRAA